MEDSLSAQSGIFWQESARDCILAGATRSLERNRKMVTAYAGFSSSQSLALYAKKPWQTAKNTVRKEAFSAFA
jgi:hypothetical protein